MVWRMVCCSDKSCSFLPIYVLTQVQLPIYVLTQVGHSQRTCRDIENMLKTAKQTM